ncbi:MAG: winged helix-turn-helix transcriptional regulator [Planctomycetota bacterium]|nr:MAG: winged helix-turn-helix transcriptional regulator [Planctomycetota bacterium]
MSMPNETTWTFLSNHAHVLICLNRDPGLRIRDLAELVGITERAVQRIISELVEGNYISINKDGRRNTYEIHSAKPLRHPVEQHRCIRDLLHLIS